MISANQDGENAKAAKPVRDKVVKAFNEDLRARLEAFQINSQMGLKQLAAECGTSSTTLSRYLNKKPEGDIVALEEQAEELLRTAADRRETKVELVTTKVIKTLFSRLDTVRKTQDLGLVYGAAGVGKSCALKKYLEENPTTMKIEVSQWSKSGVKVEDLMMSCVDRRGYRGNHSRVAFLIQALKDSKRLLIIDDAHKLSMSGLKFCIDFHDRTGIPMTFVGNPEILRMLERNDQMFSRIGLSRPVELDPVDEVNASKAIVAQLAPQWVGQIDDLVALIAHEQGHLRAVKKQVLLALDIAEKESFKKQYGNDAREAIRGAHLNLIRNYKLPPQ